MDGGDVTAVAICAFFGAVVAIYPIGCVATQLNEIKHESDVRQARGRIGPITRLLPEAERARLAECDRDSPCYLYVSDRYQSANCEREYLVKCLNLPSPEAEREPK